MSCIRFSTPAQREAIRRDAAALQEGDGAILHLAPPVTASKIARLRLLAGHERAGIRQSVAANRHAPADLLEALAADPDAGVRGDVAHNESTPAAVVVRLAADRDARVRCWAVLNPVLPEEHVDALAADRDAQVRRLAAWRIGARVGLQPS
jgi:Leucine rich repeat variant